MKLTDRDYQILREIYRWRFCLGRHVKDLCKFKGARATDRRVKILCDNGYLEKERLIYGVPTLYTLTYKGRVLLGVNARADKIRIERIAHDIAVLDTVCYMVRERNLSLSDIKSEKELHAKDGFSYRQHRPDFTFLHKGWVCAVEVEMTLKSKERIEKNVKENYLAYDEQIWIVPSEETRIIKLLQEQKSSYDKMYILSLGVIRSVR